MGPEPRLRAAHTRQICRSALADAVGIRQQSLALRWAQNFLRPLNVGYTAFTLARISLVSWRSSRSSVVDTMTNLSSACLIAAVPMSNPRLLVLITDVYVA